MTEKKCQKKCELDVLTNTCIGCGRTLEEIYNAGINASRTRRWTEEDFKRTSQLPKSRNTSRKASEEAETSGDGIQVDGTTLGDG
jgi:predicted Fe-S protein YdhL (DUF1289 family)